MALLTLTLCQIDAKTPVGGNALQALSGAISAFAHTESKLMQ
jgi:hypothetical protein